jgi:ribonuclease R
MTDSLPLAEDREEGAAIADKPTAPFVTIDGASTRDIDDAIRVEHIGSGYRIQVAISDPTKLVDIGSTEDENARLLGATVYFGDHPARRMLVARISEDEGSLVAGKSRPVFVMQIDLDETLEIKDFSVKHQRIKVDKRLTCEEIPVILQDVDHPLRPMLGTAAQLSGMLLAKRRRSGALAIYDLARLLISDEEGKLIATHRDQIVGQIIIQEFMVLANTEMAQYLVKHDIPGVFRNHEPKSMTAPADELAALIESWLQADGMNLEQVRDQFQSIAGRASYSSKVKGHFALATACYGHFTSPLRRYADLVNLRQVKAHLKKTSLPYTAAEIEPLAESLNATADKERETRSDGFKTVVIRTAERALQQNTLNRLADHELVQATCRSSSMQSSSDGLRTRSSPTGSATA